MSGMASEPTARQWNGGFGDTGWEGKGATGRQAVIWVGTPAS